MQRLSCWVDTDIKVEEYMNFFSLKALTFSLLLGVGTILKADFDQSHKVWTDVLVKYTAANGDVHYKQLKDSLAKTKTDHPFSQYLAKLESVSKKDFDGWARTDQMAYLINAYNAYTVKLIVDNYPVRGIRSIGGIFRKPWGIEFFSLLDGTLKSLDPIEHDVLRPVYKDYRIHAAVNCASVSCPPLRREAFRGKDLDRQLTEQMQTWLADSSRNVFEQQGQARVSKIFDWYRSDFEDWGGGLAQVLKKYGPVYATEAIENARRIEFLSYDWALNEAK